MHTLKLFQGTPFLGGRQVAFKVRSQAIQFLTTHPQQTLVLDFTDVRGVSHSFSDELLSPLSDLLGCTTSSRVIVTHCDEMVRDGLQGVAELHDLHLPKFVDLELCAA